MNCHHCGKPITDQIYIDLLKRKCQPNGNGDMCWSAEVIGRFSFHKNCFIEVAGNEYVPPDIKNPFEAFVTKADPASLMAPRIFSAYSDNEPTYNTKKVNIISNTIGVLIILVLIIGVVMWFC